MDSSGLPDCRELIREQRILRQQVGWLDEVVRSQGNLRRESDLRVHRLELKLQALHEVVQSLLEALLQRSVVSRADIGLHTLD